MNVQKLQEIINPVIDKMAELDTDSLGKKVKVRKTRSKRKEQKRLQIQAIRRRTGWQPPKGMAINPDRY